MKLGAIPMSVSNEGSAMAGLWHHSAHRQRAGQP
jgi:hypothetical protein